MSTHSSHGGLIRNLGSLPQQCHQSTDKHTTTITTTAPHTDRRTATGRPEGTNPHWACGAVEGSPRGCRPVRVLAGVPTARSVPQSHPRARNTRAQCGAQDGIAAARCGVRQMRDVEEHSFPFGGRKGMQQKRTGGVSPDNGIAPPSAVRSPPPSITNVDAGFGCGVTGGRYVSGGCDLFTTALVLVNAHDSMRRPIRKAYGHRQTQNFRALLGLCCIRVSDSSASKR